MRCVTRNHTSTLVFRITGSVGVEMLCQVSTGCSQKNVTDHAVGTTRRHAGEATRTMFGKFAWDFVVNLIMIR